MKLCVTKKIHNFKRTVITEFDEESFVPEYNMCISTHTKTIETSKQTKSRDIPKNRNTDPYENGVDKSPQRVFENMFVKPKTNVPIKKVNLNNMTLEIKNIFA